MAYCAFADLLGKTLVAVSGAVGDDKMDFDCADGSKYRLYHDQECCERVLVEDICGDVAELIGQPILLAEEVSHGDDPEGDTREYESHTWTFYKLATNKGAVTIRWLGESNGYYSESVSFMKIE
jgi:hypothetical protein